MSTITESPSPIKKNPDWNNQVKICSGRCDTGAWHRAMDVAVRLFKAGVWDGRGLIVIKDAYRVHGKMPSFVDSAAEFVEGLVEGEDYEFASDSIYRREE